MVHPFAGIGVEAGDDETGRTFRAHGISGCIGTHDGLRPFGANVFSSFGNLAEGAAHTDGLIDVVSGASAKAAQYHAARTEGVLHGTPAGTAGALRHSDFFSQFAVGANVDAIEPRRIEVLAGLHVESDGDGISLAYGIGRRPAARAAAEVHRHALVRDTDAPVVDVAITVTILIGVLSRGERGERDQAQTRDNKKGVDCAASFARCCARK